MNQNSFVCLFSLIKDKVDEKEQNKLSLISHNKLRTHYTFTLIKTNKLINTFFKICFIGFW